MVEWEEGFVFHRKGNWGFVVKGKDAESATKKKNCSYPILPPSPYLLTVTLEEESSLLMSHEDLYMAGGSQKKTPTS